MNWQDWLNKPICMDCFEFMEKLPNNLVDLIITSPPYNCRMPYGSFQDEMPWRDWYRLIEHLLSECLAILRVGGVLALNLPLVIRWQRDHAFKDTWSDYDPGYLTHVGNLRDQKGKGRIEPVGFRVWKIMEEIGFRMREPIIWVKGTDGNAICSDYRMGCDSDPYMRPCHEIILLGSKGRWYHDGGTGRRGREAVPFIDFTKDVWHIPSVSSGGHPAPFPPELPMRLMILYIHRLNTQTLPEPIVFDPFAGSFTTATSAEILGINWLACDIAPEYIELAHQRLARLRQQPQLL